MKKTIKSLEARIRSLEKTIKKSNQSDIPLGHSCCECGDENATKANDGFNYCYSCRRIKGIK